MMADSKHMRQKVKAESAFSSLNFSGNNTQVS
jgi:hypothetical protein